MAENIQWLRWPVVGVVLLFTAVLAYNLIYRQTISYLLIALPVLLVGLYLFMRWPALGLVLMIPASMLVPFALSTGSETRLHGGVLLTLAMLGLWLLDMVEGQRRVWLHNSRPIRPLLIFIVIAILSFLVGLMPWFQVPGASIAAQIGGLFIFILSAAIFLITAHQVKDLRWLKWMTWAYILFGGIFILARLTPTTYRSIGPFYQWGSTSSQFWTWLAVILFSQAWLNKDLKWYVRLGLLGLLAALMYDAYVLTNDWKSGWIPPIVGVGAVMALYSWRIALVGGVAALGAVPVALASLIATDEYSYSTRVDAWVIMGEIIRKNPLLGLGPANYYWYTPLYAIRGYAVQFNSHNQYIDLLAQVGILGTLAILWFFVELAWVGWQLRHRVPPGFATAYLYGVMGGLIATVFSGVLGDWYLPFVYNVGFVGLRSSLIGWMFMGGLVTLQVLYGVKRET